MQVAIRINRRAEALMILLVVLTLAARLLV